MGKGSLDVLAPDTEDVVKCRIASDRNAKTGQITKDLGECISNDIKECAVE